MSNSKTPYMGITRIVTIFLSVLMMTGTLIFIAVLTIIIFNLIGIGEVLTSELQTMHWLVSIVLIALFTVLFQKSVKGCWEIYYNKNYPRIYVNWSFVFLVVRYSLGFYICIWPLFDSINRPFGETLFAKGVVLAITALIIYCNYTIGKRRTFSY